LPPPAENQAALLPPAEIKVGQLPPAGNQFAHPLADRGVSNALRARGLEIAAAFAHIEPKLKTLVERQFEESFAAQAQASVRAEFGVDLPQDVFTAQWAAPLDAGRLYARVVLGTFCRLIEREFDRGLCAVTEGESAEDSIRRWGFHAIDITPCADGRLSGVLDYILRVPPAVIAFRKSYAGAMFDVEESLRHWETVELRRWREGRPNPPDAPTRYLKLGVYHYSSIDPKHEGCAAHGSDETRAAEALRERLQQLEQALQQTHCCGANLATLLVGVDTDTDAIRVHVPDTSGLIGTHRFVDNLALYETTRSLERDAAKEAIRAAVAACAEVAVDDAASEGMRWFCGYLLKNNMAQIDAVRSWHGGAYPDPGHTERLIVVGDAVDDVQLRNLAFQAQIDTVEEGSVDLDIGIKILRGLLGPKSLAVPVLVHLRFDPRIPGAQERAEHRARRLQTAIEARYAELASAGALQVQAVVRAGETAVLTMIEPLRRAAACGCKHPESHA
jgi:carboxysome shell carbonic anhydrase